jgi:hypothetical protein
MTVKPFVSDSKEYNAIVDYLKDHRISDTNRDKRRNFFKKCEQFILNCEKLFYCNGAELSELIIHGEQQLHYETAKVFHEQHCHIRGDKFYAMISRVYFGFDRDFIRSIVKKCIACQQALPLKRTDPIKHIVSSHTFERI